MPAPDDDGVLEVHGCHFHYDGADFWMWDEKLQAWLNLPEQPSYLVVVQGKLALIDVETGRPQCNCPHLQVMNAGCKCGGV